MKIIHENDHSVTVEIDYPAELVDIARPSGSHVHTIPIESMYPNAAANRHTHSHPAWMDGAHTHPIIDQNWAQARAAARTHTADEYRPCKPERHTCLYCGCRFVESKFHPGHCISCGAPEEG